MTWKHRFILPCINRLGGCRRCDGAGGDVFLANSGSAADQQIFLSTNVPCLGWLLPAACGRIAINATNRQQAQGPSFFGNFRYHFNFLLNCTVFLSEKATHFLYDQVWLFLTPLWCCKRINQPALKGLRQYVTSSGTAASYDGYVLALFPHITSNQFPGAALGQLACGNLSSSTSHGAQHYVRAPHAVPLTSGSQFRKKLVLIRVLGWGGTPSVCQQVICRCRRLRTTHCWFLAAHSYHCSVL